jgi:hypothetical protein
VRHQLGEIASELLAVSFTGYRTLTALQKGQIPGPEAGLAKVTIVNGAIKAGDLIADVVGPDALAEDSEWAYMISFLPGLKSAGGTEEILRNTDRRARARAAARAAPGQGHPVLRAALQGRSGGMNLALSDEQVFLREAARGALSRFKTLEAAREALDGDENALPDLWPTARRGRLARAADRRGARRRRPGRVRRDARARRVRARARGVPLLGHLPATAILSDAPLAPSSCPPRHRRAASGLPARAAPRRCRRALERRPGQRPRAPAAAERRAATATVACASTAALRSCPTRPGADVLVGVALQDGRPVGVAILADAPGVASSP